MLRRSLLAVALAACACQSLDATGAARMVDARPTAVRAPPIAPLFASMGGVSADCAQDADRDRKQAACEALVETATDPAQRAAARNNLGIAFSPEDPAGIPNREPHLLFGGLAKFAACDFLRKPAGEKAQAEFLSALLDDPPTRQDSDPHGAKIAVRDFADSPLWAPRHNLGVLLMHEREYRGAFAAFDAALKRSPDNEKILAAIDEARIRSKSAPFKIICTADQFPVTNNPYHSGEHYHIWWQGDFENHLTWKMEQVAAEIDRKPKSAWAHYYRGLLMEMMARPGEAVDAWMIAIDLAPETETPRWAAILAASGRDAGRSEAELRRALMACAVDPDC